MKSMPTHKCKHICKPLQLSRNPKFAKELPLMQPEKNCIKKISFLSKNIKNSYTQPND